MAQKLKGVGGVLEGIISPEPPIPEQPETPSQSIQESSPLPAPQTVATPQPRRTSPAVVSPSRGARRGRPPGQKAGEGADKEKITLRISKALADDYRDWSWEERCQLGELVERAMTHYRKNRDRKRLD